MKDIAIVILNYNGQHYLQKFLPDLFRYSAEAEIFIADNASTDESVVFLQENFPQAGLILLDKNYGYTGGYNRAIAQLEHTYILLLNSDVRVTRDWLKPLRETMKLPGTAMVQPKILNEKNTHLFDYAGASGGYVDQLGYPFCRGRIFDHIEEDNNQYDSQASVAWATGAAVLMPRELFIRSGGFDDFFFAHMEEIDLAWRLRRSGYHIRVNPRSVVYHVGGGTLDALSPKKTFLNFRNSLFVLLKNEPHQVFGKIFLRLILDGAAGIKFLLDGKADHMFAIIKAHFNFYSNLPFYRRKRRLTKQVIADLKTGAEVQDGVLNGSIVKLYYLKKIKKFSEIKFN